MATVAILDENDVLIGYEQVAEPLAEMRIGNKVNVPDGCDLTIGKYFWNKDHWVPILEQPKDKLTLTMRAFYDAFAALEKQGFELPTTTKEWMNTWENEARKYGRIR